MKQMGFDMLSQQIQGLR